MSAGIQRLLQLTFGQVPAFQIAKIAFLWTCARKELIISYFLNFIKPEEQFEGKAEHINVDEVEEVQAGQNLLCELIAAAEDVGIVLLEASNAR